MKKVTFDEKKDFEELYKTGIINQDNCNSFIQAFAKYNLYDMELSDKNNMSTIKQWLKEHYSLYSEATFHSVIKSAITKAHKYKMFYSEDIVVYCSEMNEIAKVDDIRKEKLLFVLLCVAKLQHNLYGFKNGKYNFALTNLFKLARVNIASTERELFIRELSLSGYVDAPTRTDDTQRYVKYISDGTNDTVALKVNQIDFEELAYVYLDYVNHHEGFTRCQRCGRMMKQNKKGTMAYCCICEPQVRDGNMKVIYCVDCGEEFKVSTIDTRTCRCEDCNVIYQRNRNATKNRAYRDRNKQS